MLIDVPDYELETIQYALANYANYWEEKAHRADGRERACYKLIAEQADQIKRKWEGKHLPLPAVCAGQPVATKPKEAPKPSGGLKVVSEPRKPVLPPSPAYALRGKPLGPNFTEIDF